MLLRPDDSTFLLARLRSPTISAAWAKARSRSCSASQTSLHKLERIKHCRQFALLAEVLGGTKIGAEGRAHHQEGDTFRAVRVREQDHSRVDVDLLVVIAGRRGEEAFPAVIGANLRCTFADFL